MAETVYTTALVSALDEAEEYDIDILLSFEAQTYIVDSMSAPRQAEYLSAHYALAQDSAKLRLIDDSIEECRKRIARAHADMCLLERKRHATQRLVSIHRARLSPLRILPDELLQEIFKRCLPENRYVVPNICSAPLVLAQVCRRWRVVAQGTSELWSSIALRDLGVWNYELYVDMVKRWLSHVRTRPMRMSITCPAHTDFGLDSSAMCSDIFRLVTAHDSQLQDLCLNVNRTYLHHFVNGTTLPALRRILISLHSDSRISELPQHITPVVLSAPNIKSVEFLGYGTSIDVIPLSISQQISHLSFDCNMLLDFTLLFRDYPSLQHLTIKLSISRDALRVRLPPRNSEMAVARLLERFEVCLDRGLLEFGDPSILEGMFAQLSFPSLEELAIVAPLTAQPCGLSSKHYKEWFAIASVSPFFARSRRLHKRFVCRNFVHREDQEMKEVVAAMLGWTDVESIIIPMPDKCHWPALGGNP